MDQKRLVDADELAYRIEKIAAKTVNECMLCQKKDWEESPPHSH